MRATISFDVDIEKVSTTMWALVLEEAANLGETQVKLENADQENLMEELSRVIKRLSETTSQLGQYQQMLAGFERARLETILPAPASEDEATQAGQPASNLGEVRDAIRNMKSFDGFLEAINNNSPEEEGNHDPEEG